MSPDSPGDKWFFEALKSGRAVDINIDYNSGRNDTFVFINALVGDVHQPVAVAGVGLSMQSIAEEFSKYKYGVKSNLWLVDSSGKIHLSDDFNYNGRNLSDFFAAGYCRTGCLFHNSCKNQFYSARKNCRAVPWQRRIFLNSLTPK